MFMNYENMLVWKQAVPSYIKVVRQYNEANVSLDNNMVVWMSKAVVSGMGNPSLTICPNMVIYIYH
jgi:hypothetical protein